MDRAREEAIMVEFQPGDKVKALKHINDSGMTTVPTGAPGVVNIVRDRGSMEVIFEGYFGEHERGAVLTWSNEVTHHVSSNTRPNVGDTVTATGVVVEAVGGGRHLDLDAYDTEIRMHRPVVAAMPTTPGSRVKSGASTYILTTDDKWVNVETGYVRKFPLSLDRVRVVHVAS